MNLSTNPAIDYEILNNLEHDTSREIMPELIDVFLQNAAQRVDDMKSAIVQADAKLIAQEAHALKSSSATFGAMTMHHLCLELETAGQNGQTAGLAKMVDELEKAFRHAETDLKKHIQTLSVG